MKSIVLDSGALIAIERGREGLELSLRTARARGRAVLIPAGCLAQVWRRPSRQVLLSRFISKQPESILAMTADDARACGLLLEATGTNDVIDAHVAVLATRHDATVLTSDPDDIRRLSPRLRVQQI